MYDVPLQSDKRMSFLGPLQIKRKGPRNHVESGDLNLKS